MKIANEKVVSLKYKMYVTNEDGKEELWEETPEKHPLTYCHGEKMMLQKFEEALEGLEEGQSFDFTIAYQDAYGDYDEKGVLTLDKKLFYNGDGEFDSERVVEGNIIPMNTQDGQIVNAQVVEIGADTVTIDLNHPLAGEDLHFVGEVISIREADAKELEAIRSPHKCGRCHGNCGDCGNCGNECNKTK
ncbi:MAG: FKBP-type peptidyl-prolyl cis-trans isomerase [Paludibacteraceae bacterium]|nr:FKBP-type peptidyl-prolyl cis-trans isomerase [Paludibacteraceae bacterium]